MDKLQGMGNSTLRWFGAFAWLLLVFTLAACNIFNPIIPDTTPTVPPQVEADEYLVYAAVIKSLYAVGPALQVVLNDHTDLSKIVSPEKFTELGQDSPAIDLAAEANFQNRNLQKYPLQDHLNLASKLILISSEDFKKIIGPGLNADSFYAAFPNAQGFLTLSRVGFNPARTQAIVYTAEWKGPLNGTGYLYFLVKSTSLWTIKTKILDWIS